MTRSLEETLAHPFAQPALLAEALRHPSYANEHPATGPSNQRLEFLGDAVLQLVVSTELYQLYPDSPEGELSKRRAALTQGPMLATLAAELGVAACLQLGESERANPSARGRATALEDACEAIFGAVYLDAGLVAARAVILRAYGSLPARLQPSLATDNPKGRLQERLQPAHGNQALRYHTAQAGGADHAREYASEVWLHDTLLGRGSGPSKKIAEEAAAAAALLHPRVTASAPSP
jgi:ribonuclease III